MQIRRCVLVAAVWGFGLLLPALGGAAPVQCPPTCPGGPPYSQAEFLGTINADYYELTPPYVLNLFPYSDALGAGQAAADPTSGTLRAYSTATAGNPQFTTFTTVSDVFTLHSSSVVGPVIVTIILDASGTGLIPIEGDILQTTVFFQGDSVAFNKKVFQAGTPPTPIGAPFSIALYSHDTFTETIGVPFNLSYGLRIDSDDTSSGNFLSPFSAQFTLILPPGVTVSSLAGFSGTPLDTDGDGIPDNVDNCPYAPNGPLLGTCLGPPGSFGITCHVNADCGASGTCDVSQTDRGGISTATPDGIGDACQCGDVNNDGIVNNTDATLIKRAVAGLAPYAGGVTTLPGYNKCQVVNGAPGLTCNNSQATIIQRAVAGLAPGIVQGCHAATIFP